MAKPAAVVVGRNLNALGVVRSLAGGGVAVVLLCTSRFDLAALSRHCQLEITGSLGGRALIQALKSLRRRFDATPVLFLTEEQSVASIAEMGAELACLYHMSTPSRRVTELLSNKALFHEFATREGLPLPRGRVIRRAEDIGTLEDFDLPVIVKPADKRRVADGPDQRVILAGSYREAIGRCRQFVAEGAGAIVQAWIGGPDDAVYFCLFHAAEDGTPLVLFTGRKLVSFPKSVGITAICAPAPSAHAELAALTTRLTKRLQMSGLGSLEFKWDAASQRFVIIEPTVGRSDWQEEIATLSGVNIPLAAYAHFCGQPLPPQPAEPALVAWRWPFWRRPPRGSLAPGTRIRDGCWRLTDPAPGVAYYLLGPPRRLCERVAREIRVRFRASDPKSSRDEYGSAPCPTSRPPSSAPAPTAFRSPPISQRAAVLSLFSASRWRAGGP